MDRLDPRGHPRSFLVGAIGGIVALMLAVPLGAALGIGDAASGHYAVVTYAAIPIAVIAAIASRAWLGVVGLLAGFAVAGAVAGVLGGLGSSGDVLTDAVGSALVVLLSMGFVGAPAYVLTILAVRLVTRVRRPDEGVLA
jgi:hypothetical protein